MNFADYFNFSEYPPLKDQYMGFSFSHCSVFNTLYRMDKKTLDGLKLDAKRMNFLNIWEINDLLQSLKSLLS
jgi:hypothetical protein